MAIYGDDYNSLRRRNQSYFAGANPGAGNQGFPLAPGVAAGNAQIQSMGTPSQNRAGGRMVTSPSGGSMWVPTGKVQSYLDKGYQNYQAPRTALQQFDINRAYAQGYGAPTPTIQQGAGGPYRVAGGVAAPISNPPNFFQRQASNLYSGLTTAFPAISQYLFGGRGGQYAGQSAGGAAPQNQNYYAYNPSPMAYQPNRYFD